MGRLRKFAVAAVAALVVVGGLAIPTASSAPIQYSPTPIFNWSTNGIVRTVLIVGDTAYAGGDFTAVTGPGGSPTLPRSGLAAFDIHTGAIRSGFVADTNGRVESLASDGTNLYVGGDYTTLNGQNRARLASVNLSTGTANNGFSVGATSHVYALTLRGNRLYVGGAFGTLGGVARARIGIVDKTTGAVDPTFNPSPDNSVHAIKISPDGNTAYVGGDFTTIAGATRGNIAPLDATTGAILPLTFAYPPSFTQIPTLIDLDLSPSGDRLFAALGGDQNQALSWSTNTGRLQWSHQVDGDTQSVKYFNGNVYFGFHEGDLGDPTVRMLVADSTTGVVDPTYRLPIDSFYGTWDIDASQDGLVLGGEFAHVNGVATQGIAILPHTTTDTTPPTTPTNLHVASTTSTSITTAWNAGTDNAGVAGYRILRNGVEIGFTTDLTYTDFDLPSASDFTYQVQTVDTGENFSPPTTALPAGTDLTVIAAGSVWKYLDNGSNQGTAWRANTFNDTTWASGPAQLGYGDGDEATVVGFGPDPNNKYYTTYFRRQINIANAAGMTNVNLQLLRDDGAVVYVNGTEVARSNMPTGTITSTTAAAVSIDGAGEQALFQYSVPPNVFVNGTNTIAVEVHQAYRSSSDISFDLTLGTGRTLASAAPANLRTTSVTGTTANLAWDAPSGTITGYRVYRDGTLVGSPTGTTFGDTGLTSAATYNYTVTAINNTGLESSPTAPLPVTTPDVVAPSVPTSLTLDTNSATRVVFHWTPSTDNLAVTSYDVLRNGVQIGTSTTTSYTDNNVGPNVSYSYTVRARDAANNASNASAALPVTTPNASDLTPPSAPQNLRTVSVSTTQLTLAWDASTDNVGVTNYVVSRNGVDIGTTPLTTLSDSLLSPGASYTYTVRALDAALNISNPSTALNVTTHLATETAFPSGSVWKYTDDGVDRGTAWSGLAYNDSSWKSGPAQLGYGDGDEATVMFNGGTDPATRFISHYLRRNVNVSDPSQLNGVTLSVLRDDGVVVYVNGVEAFRDNMPAGPITINTFASTTAVTDAAESTFYDFTIPPSMFQSGNNVIAVELHNESRQGTGDISFDARLTLRYGTPIVNPPTNLRSTGTTGTTASLAWDAPSGPITGYRVYRGGVLVGSPSGTTFTDVGLTSTQTYNYTVTAVQVVSPNTFESVPAGPLAVTTADTIAPVVTLTQPANGAALTNSPVTFAGACTTGDGNVSVAVTGTAAANLSTACNAGAWTTSTALPFGSFSATASQTDASSNTGTSTTNGFTLASTDTTAPVTTDNTATIGNAWRNTNATVTLTPSDTGSGVAATYYTTDGSTPTTASSQGTSIVLSAAGTYTIKYFSVDNIGNTEAVNTAGTQIRIDKAAPATTDNSATIGNAWRTTPATVTLSPSDTGGSGVAATYSTTDGSTPTTSSAQGTAVTLSADGTYTVKYFSVDAAGNAEPVQTAGTQIRIDSGAPTTTDNTGTIGNAWRNTNTTVALTPVDTGSGVAATYYTTDGSTPTTASTQGASILLTTNGTYTIKYFSVDTLGNAEAVKTAANQIRIDKTAPTTTDDSASTGNVWRSTPATVTLSPSDTGGSGVAATYYTTDGSTPTTSSAQGTAITLSADGTYTVKYFSVDAAGNAEPVQTAGTQIRIDSGAPVTTDNSASVSSPRNAAVTVTLTPADAGSGVAATYYTTDGSTPTTASAQGTAILLSGDGTYTIKYFSVDTLGNAEAVKTASKTITIDTAAPAVTLTQPADGASLNTASVTFAGACSTGDGNVTVTITGSSSTTASGACTAGAWTAAKALPSGSYSATASQTDAAGNTGTSGANGFDLTSPDSDAPVTTDDTATIGNAWHAAPVTVTLTPTDASGVAATYYTTDGSTPTTASAQGTSVSLTTNGTYTIRYFSVDTLGNTEAVKTAGTQIRVDTVAPVTTDNTATIGNAWRRTSATVTLSRTDASSGVATTYYTTDGSTPTTASTQGTSIVLSATGTYTIRYFSVDAVGNVEAVKTAGTQIRIDTALPTAVFTFPVTGSVFNTARWNAGCATARICGTAADANSGVASVGLTIQRSSDSRWWNGSTWQTTSSTRTATGTTSWFLSLPTSALTNGVTYTVTVRSTDTAGNQSAAVVTTFTYDTAAPATSSTTVANHSGTVQTTVDTFSVTFGEALDPSTVPATATLTLSRSNGNTSYSISGITNGLQTTGTTGYLTSATTTRTVTYAGSVVLSNSNRTITFTVTGGCAGSCTALSPTVRTGRYVFAPATTLLDRAGNAATGTLTSSTQAMF